MMNVFYYCAFVGLLHKIRYKKNLLPFRHKCCLSNAKSFFSNCVFTGKYYFLCGYGQFILEGGGCCCMPHLLSTSQVSGLFSYHYVG
jgi:hypothetical protein